MMLDEIRRGLNDALGRVCWIESGSMFIRMSPKRAEALKNELMPTLGLSVDVGVDRIMGLLLCMSSGMPDRYATLEAYRKPSGHTIFRVPEVVGVVDFGEV